MSPLSQKQQLEFHLNRKSKSTRKKQSLFGFAQSRSRCRRSSNFWKRQEGHSDRDPPCHQEPSCQSSTDKTTQLFCDVPSIMKLNCSFSPKLYQTQHRLCHCLPYWENIAGWEERHWAVWWSRCLNQYFQPRLPLFLPRWASDYMNFRIDSKDWYTSCR